MEANFEYGTWVPTLQIGNGIIAGDYRDQTGHWCRVNHQIFVNGFFRLNYNEKNLEEAIYKNTTWQEVRIGTMPYEANAGASIFGMMVSNNHFIRDLKLSETTGGRSIWGSPRMRVFANQHTVARDLNLEDIKPSTNGIFTEVRVSGVYTAFPDLMVTDPVNTPPPMVTRPPLETEISVGAAVKIKDMATHWATGQPIPPWAKGEIYTVIALRNGGKELLLDFLSSWINVEDVMLI